MKKKRVKTATRKTRAKRKQREKREKPTSHDIARTLEVFFFLKKGKTNQS